MLAIESSRRAMQLSYESAMDLLYFASGILLVSGALYLSTSMLSSEEAEDQLREEQ
jgi:hypothetical protein